MNASTERLTGVGRYLVTRKNNAGTYKIDVTDGAAGVYNAKRGGHGPVGSGVTPELAVHAFHEIAVELEYETEDIERIERL